MVVLVTSTLYTTANAGRNYGADGAVVVEPASALLEVLLKYVYIYQKQIGTVVLLVHATVMLAVFGYFRRRLPHLTGYVNNDLLR